MIRTATALAACFLLAATAEAQLIVRPPPARPKPAGVILPPSLPLPGGTLLDRPANTQVRPRFVANPLRPFAFYAPYWPVWDDSYEQQPAVVVNNFVPVPTPAPEPAPPPPPPPELRARLTLDVPAGAHVFLAGREVDAAIRPLILESPVLQSGQAYVFDVRVTWVEGRKTEERSRVVTVAAAESKSLTYTADR